LTLHPRAVRLRRTRFLGTEYFEHLFNESPEAIVVAANDGSIIRVNREFSRLFGFEEAEAVGRSIDDLIAPKGLYWEAAGTTTSVANGHKIALETTRQRKDGGLIQVSILGVPVLIQEHQDAVYAIYRDISDRKRDEEALLREKAYLEQLVETAAEGIVMLDGDGIIQLHNGEFCRMFGYAPEEVLGHGLDDLIVPEECRGETEYLTGVMKGGGRMTLESRRRRKDGSLIQVNIIGSPITLHGRQVAFYAIYRDISDMHRAQQEILKANEALQERTRQLEEANARLERISNYDGLTAVPNRRYFEQFYELEWRRAWREQRWISLIMIDVDFFKTYNDRNGHLAGDDCLKRLAQSLQVVNRASDLMARYGGEEFVAVLAGTDPAGALMVARRMQERVQGLRLPHGDSSASPYVTVSMGVASQIPDTPAIPEDLLMKADQALYQAKAEGRNRIVVSGAEGRIPD
jgi:diguanylate cyclase (GGDEF)-like protein/PAS domain S-box-containing protein